MNRFHQGKTVQGVQGGALVTALAISAVLAIGVASYLTLVAHQNTLVNRSQAWNRAMANAEAGIEEGLAQINIFFGTNGYQASAKANWGSNASGFYGVHTGALSAGFYSAIIDAKGVNPTIYSTGYATIPMSGEVVQRTVQVTASP